jgi:glycosyltransferase involved in cell wall biosynthesis
MIVGAPPPVGPGVDVPAVVRELGLTQTVTIIPERSDITDLIEGAHVVVVPSVRADPLPTIAIEAARAGRAVMASNCGGLPEIVSDGLTGWLVQPGDMGDWARALKGVDRTEARVRGAAARAGFVERFGRERFGAELRRVASSSLVLEQAIPNATTPQPDAPRGENRRYRQ